MKKESSGKFERQSIRWIEADWAWVGEVARALGVSRSEFVRTSVLAAAKESGHMPSYSVNFRSQNTRIDPFSDEVRQRATSGGRRNAADCSRSDAGLSGGANQEGKGGPTRKSKKGTAKRLPKLD